MKQGKALSMKSKISQSYLQQRRKSQLELRQQLSSSMPSMWESKTHSFGLWHHFDQHYHSTNNQSQSSMTAIIAISYTTSDPNQYPDSGATNHIISYVNNLTNRSNYPGNEQIHIGDGSGLKILHAGSSSFLSQINSKILSLKQLLHVPRITKILLSVSKFASENNVFFEFFPKCCYFK